jgi:hypothetical protein
MWLNLLRGMLYVTTSCRFECYYFLEEGPWSWGVDSVYFLTIGGQRLLSPHSSCFCFLVLSLVNVVLGHCCRGQ